jgi:hypothetical protein
VKLTELDPGFMNHPESGLMLLFRCPKCNSHHIGVPVTVGIKQPGRWMITTRDFETLTAVPSLRYADPPTKDTCLYHVSIKNGEIIPA